MTILTSYTAMYLLICTWAWGFLNFMSCPLVPEDGANVKRRHQDLR